MTGNDKTEYVRLEDMTEADIAYNVRRLRAEADAAFEQANALEAFRNDKEVQNENK